MTRRKAVYLQVGDVVFTRGESLLGKAIRWAETEPGEEPTEANHVGVITAGGMLGEAKITEALWKVRTHSLFRRYHGNGEVAVFRPKNLLPKDRRIIQEVALSHEGQTYGWWKLLFHLAARVTRIKAFTKILFVDDRPICSFLVARAYEAAGYTFGMEGRSADPDEMMDFCLANPDKYEPVIYPMQEI